MYPYRDIDLHTGRHMLTQDFNNFTDWLLVFSRLGGDAGIDNLPVNGV